MEYVLLLAADEKVWASFSPEEAQRQMGAYTAYTKALHDAGVLLGGNQLDSVSTATTVRVSSDGKTTVLDGPYAETKEQLGGYYLIDVPDLDAAIAWAARCPGASHGTVEVRPIVSHPAPV